jgi:hypothetical protein
MSSPAMDVTPGLDDSQFITVKCRQCSSHYPLREINKHMLQCVKTSQCVGWESIVSITTSDRLKYKCDCPSNSP